jgi:type II secretory pathway pseudopilin PulG
MRFARGATLIEMTVVMTIMVILYGILASVVPGARHSARMAACTGNLRQIVMAVGMYCQDWNDYPPQYAWAALYPSYVPSEGVMVCPNDPLPPARQDGRPGSSYVLQARGRGSCGAELTAALRRRGDMFPAVICLHHVMQYPSNRSFVLVGRLGGQVDKVPQSSLDERHEDSSWDY